MAFGVGAAILMLTVAPATAANASGLQSVPCSGGGTGLIAAINAANTSGGGTINLAPGCTYSLNSYDNAGIGYGYNGLPQIVTPITINGLATTIAGNPGSATPFRIFEVDSPGTLTLQGLTITGGVSPGLGGGIFNAAATVTLNHSRVTGNTASGYGGGGIASATLAPPPVPRLTLNFSQVDNNTATSGASGGGILNAYGTMTLNSSQVHNNTADGEGGGFLNDDGTVRVNFSQVRSNTATGNCDCIAAGGGIGNEGPDATLKLFFSQVNNNASNGLPVTGAGGIANGGVATLTLSQVDGNSAPAQAGGGIQNYGTMTINLSQVNNNSTSGSVAGYGGGIADISLVNVGAPTLPGVLTVNASQVNNNEASYGGGISEGGLCPGSPGAPPVDCAGGIVALTFSQVRGNTALIEGGGISITPGSGVTLKTTFVRNNTPDNCDPSIPGC